MYPLAKGAQIYTKFLNDDVLFAIFAEIILLHIIKLHTSNECQGRIVPIAIFIKPWHI